MDIHKPKPWPGFREFLNEYLIIVVGVLTALAAEQMVVGLRDQRASAEARESVRAEIANDLSVLARRNEEQACIDKRLQEIDALLIAADGGASFHRVRWIGRPRTGPISTFRLQSASQSGRTSLFGVDEQATFALIYFPLVTALDQQGLEQMSWSHLQGLMGFHKLSPEMLLNLRQALGEARYEDYRIRLATARANEQAANLKIKPTPIVETRMGGGPTCQPMFDAGIDRR